MKPELMIEQCKAVGVEVWLEGDEVRLKGKRRLLKWAVQRLRPYKPQILQLLREDGASGTKTAEADPLLDKFQFELVEVDPAPEELMRVNNICYHLVTAKGWTFEEAIVAAAVWVASNPPHSDEAEMTDVHLLWRMRR